MISSRPAAAALLSTALFFASSVSAKDFFVSPSGDNANDGTSVSAPWRTIAKANAALRPGDTVYLRGGQYLNDPIRPAQSGTSSQRIRYAAYENEEPVLTSKSVGGLEVAIELSGRSYITVEGVHVDGVAPNPKSRVNHFVSIYGGHYNTIAGCTFRFATGWHGIRITEGAHHNKLLNNTIDVVGIYDDGTGQDWGDSIQIIREAHHNLVEGNTILRGSHNLLQVTGQYNVIRGNTFENDWSGILESGHGGRNVELIGKHNVFEHNVVRKASQSTDKPANAGMKAEGQSNIVRFNFIHSNSNEGITSQSRNSQKWALDNHIFHNTIYSNGGPAWSLIYFDGGNGVTRNIFKNNIVWGNGRTGKGGADILFDLGSNPTGVVGEPQVVNNLIAGSSGGDASIDVRSGGGVMSMKEAEETFAKYFKKNILSNLTFMSSKPETPADFALAPGSRGIDEAAPLTVTRSAGSGKVVQVEDARYFSDGYTIVSGDRIQIGGGPPITVVKVDYAADSLTLADDTEWQADAPVSLEYHGAGPDVGAFEVGLSKSGAPRRQPKSPDALQTNR